MNDTAHKAATPLILIVDDEKSIRLTLKAFLAAEGYDVVVAEEAREAMGLLRSRSFDVIVSDIILPRMSGVKLLAEIKNISPETKVIMMTGEPTLETAAESLRHGAFEYLAKPVTKEDLLIAVRNASDLKQSEDSRQRLEAEKQQYTHHLEQVVEERTRSLKESEERLFTVLNSIDAYIYVADMQTHEILFMNRIMQESFGRNLTGETCWKVFRGETQPCRHCTSDQIVDPDGNPSGMCVWEGKNPVTGKWYLNHDRAIKWDDGRIVRLQAATDITRLKESEEKRLLVEKQLRQAQKMEAIGTLAGGIAHDFNNILSAVLGFSELALEDADQNSDQYGHIKEVMSAGHRAKELVGHILAFSRQTEPEFETTEVKPLLKEALKFLRATLPATIEFEENIQTDATVRGDPTQIHQVIMNLGTNAAHSMRNTGGVLSVELTRSTVTVEDDNDSVTLAHGEYLLLTVSDTGEGILPEILDRIFDPFFTTKDKGEGTGMGLSVVHGIIKECNGEILVESQPGKGTTFKVWLPVAESSEKKETEDSQQMPIGSERILMVDDEAAILKAGQRILTALGYRVDTCLRGIDAVQMIEEQPDRFDLVVTDMIMPKMTGLDLIEKVSGICPDLPLIVCSGFSEKIDPQKMKQLGIRALIKKPFLSREMAQTIRDILDREAGP